MYKYILICFCLFTLSLSFYRPLSKLNINSSSDICYFKDITADSAIFNLEFVKGCANNKKCIRVDYSDSNVMSICQNSQSLSKASCSACDNDFECQSPAECTGNKCVSSGDDCSASGTGTTTGCASDKIKNYYNGDCESEREQKKAYCFTYDSTGHKNGDYQEDTSAKICGKLNVKKNNGDNNYYKEYSQWVYYGSVPDGEFVEDKEACQSGYALYFYGDKTLENPLNSDTHQMFLLCVTVLDVEFGGVTTGTSSCDRIKYKIGSNGNELIYDLSNLSGRGSYNSDCDYLLMIKLELFKKYKEEYDKVKEQCNTQNLNNVCNKDELMKWWYLYNHPREYLLYKDQTEVLDYLIQRSNPSYTPETGKAPETTPVAQPAEKTEDEPTTETGTDSSRFLNIKYFIFLLFGLFEL